MLTGQQVNSVVDQAYLKREDFKWLEFQGVGLAFPKEILSKENIYPRSDLGVRGLNTQEVCADNQGLRSQCGEKDFCFGGKAKHMTLEVPPLSFNSPT